MMRIRKKRRKKRRDRKMKRLDERNCRGEEGKGRTRVKMNEGKESERIDR